MGTPVESSIWRAYVSEVRVDGTFHTYEVPVKPLAMVLTVTKLVSGPFLRVMVTPPTAWDQVMLKALPAVMELKDGSVNSTACARAKAAAAAMIFENCILVELKVVSCVFEELYGEGKVLMWMVFVQQESEGRRLEAL